MKLNTQNWPTYWINFRARDQLARPSHGPASRSVPFMPNFLTGEGSKAHVKRCRLCNQPFTKHNDLRKHMSFHGNEEPYKCTTCNQGFLYYSQLLQHEKAVHRIEVPPQNIKKILSQNIIKPTCTICDKSFSSKYALKVHETVHTGEQPYECSLCGKRFSVKGNCMQHERNVHRFRNLTRTSATFT